MGSEARDIVAPKLETISRTVSNSFTKAGSFSYSISPTSTFHSPPSSLEAFRQSAKQLKPFDTKDIKVLLLENVNQTGRDILKEQGYQVEFYKSSLPEDELIEKIRCASLRAPRCA